MKKLGRIPLTNEHTIVQKDISMLDTRMQKQMGANILINRIKWEDCDSRLVEKPYTCSKHVGIKSMGDRLYWLFSKNVAGYSEQMDKGFWEQGTIRR